MDMQMQNDITINKQTAQKALPYNGVRFLFKTENT